MTGATDFQREAWLHEIRPRRGPHNSSYSTLPGASYPQGDACKPHAAAIRFFAQASQVIDKQAQNTV
jgi:hypothetical protein